VVKPFIKSKDKWEGEDEEEDVKDNWDDEDEEEKPAQTATTTAPGSKKNKLKEKLAEKERLEELQRLERARALMTPEELAAEKLRQAKLQEESELLMVKQAFGQTEIDTADPMTKDDFDELRKKLVQDLRRFEKRAPFEDFVEDMVQDLCLSLPSKRLKKVKTSVEALYFEKAKTEKAATSSKSSAKSKPGKVKLNVGGDRDMLSAYGGADDMDEFDDFM
jgi:translation initiation factor 3 subunit J